MTVAVAYCSRSLSTKTCTFRSLLARCRIRCTCHTKRHLKAQRWSVWFCGVSSILTSKCAWCHNGQVKCQRWILTWKCTPHHHALNVFIGSTFESAPKPLFVHFHVDMFLMPQQCSIESLASGPRMVWFWCFDLTAACNSSSIISPDCSALAASASLFFDPLEP